MLQSTFQLLPGLGPVRERRLWCAGVATWSDLAGRPGPVVSDRADPLLRAAVGDAMAALGRGDVDRLAGALPASEHWRLFDAFGDDAAYLDIETGDDVWGREGISAIGFLDKDGPRFAAGWTRSSPVSGVGPQMEPPGDVQRAVVRCADLATSLPRLGSAGLSHRSPSPSGPSRPSWRAQEHRDGDQRSQPGAADRISVESTVGTPAICFAAVETGTARRCACSPNTISMTSSTFAP